MQNDDWVQLCASSSCCASYCNPISFAFLSLTVKFSYSQSGSTKITTCVVEACVVEVTHANGTTETVDAVAQSAITYTNQYYDRVWHTDTGGYIVLCGKRAQWRVDFGGSGGVDFTGKLDDAVTVEEYGFSAM